MLTCSQVMLKLKGVGCSMQAHSEKLERRRSRRNSSADTALLDVFPVRGVKSPCDDGEHAEEQQNPDADANACVLAWLAHPLQVAHQIAHGFVVLLGCHAARLELFPSLEHMRHLAVLLH